MKHVYLYVLNTLADWEPSYLLAELNTGRFLQDHQKFPVKTVGVSEKPVHSMGGLTITPEATVSDLNRQNVALLVLPGADTWAEKQHAAILKKAAELLEADLPVAAICGATIALGEAGMLDHRPHTSNDLEALKHLAPHYQGEQFYQQKPVVQDKNLVTGSGVAPVHFAATVMQLLGAMTPEVAEAWLDLNTRQDPKAFYKLMELTQGDAA